MSGGFAVPLDALLDAIAAADGPAVVAAVRAATEPERAEAAKIVLPAAMHEGRGWFERGADGGLEFHEREDYYAGDFDWRQWQVVRLAAIGTGTLPDLRRVQAWGLSFLDPETVAALLLDRRPSWIGAFATWFLRAETYQSTWPHIRPLIHAGLVERPPDDLYLGGMLSATRRDDSRAGALLARDPELLDGDLWELLAYNTGDESLTAVDAAGGGWGQALATDPRIDRDRLLDALLSALGSDLSAYRSTWYTRLWRDLKVSADERAARVDRLRALLGAAAAPIVGFAVGELGRIEPVPAGLEHELAAALTATAKKTVRAALKLLDRSDSPTERRGAARARTRGRGRPGRGARPARALGRRSGGAPRPARPAGRDPAPAGGGAAGPRPAGARRGTARAQRTHRGRPGGAPDGAALRRTVPEAPLAGEPVLGDPIAPIATPDELADALGAALLDPWQSRDERLLDAILRRCDRPYDGPHEDRLGPWTSVSGVAHAWLARTTEQPDLGIAFVEPDAGLLSQRVRAAARRAAAGKRGPLLALPTHTGGWIAPAALVARLTEVGEDVDEPELLQALLRLAPDGRAAALAAAADLRGRPGRVVRCALGGAEVPADGPAAVAARVVREPPLDPIPEVRVNVEDEHADVTSYRVGLSAPAPLAALYGATTQGRFDEPVEPILWPGRRDLACAGAIGRVAWGFHWSLSGDDVPQLLELLLNDREPLTPLALRLLAVALCANDDRVHLLAADVIIAAIEDGRLDAAGLAAPLRQDLPSGLLLTTRLGPRLAVVGRAGTLQRAVVRDLLDAALPSLATLETRVATPLLVLFDELCAQTNSGPVASRAFLATVTGSSKAAKAAKALLARTGEPHPMERALMLEARIERADRWLSAR